eukprot:scaffold13645_cov101-Isochrysis_galbana.AAC.2
MQNAHARWLLALLLIVGVSGTRGATRRARDWCVVCVCYHMRLLLSPHSVAQGSHHRGPPAEGAI